MDNKKRKKRKRGRWTCDTANSLKHTVLGYAQSSTAHGISYIFEAGQPGSERVLWAAVVASCFAAAGFLSYQMFCQWQENPVITSVSTTALPIERVPFPAVTICAQGLVQQIVSSAITDKFRAHLRANGTDLSELTSLEKAAEYKAYMEDRFAGLNPHDVIFSMAMPSSDASPALASVLQRAATADVVGSAGFCYRRVIGLDPNASYSWCNASLNSMPAPDEFFNFAEQKRFDEDTSFGLSHSDPVISDRADRSLLGFFKMDPSPINPLIAAEAKVGAETAMAGLLPHCGGQAPWENTVVCVNDLGDYAATSIGADKTSTSSKASESAEPLVDMFLNPAKVAAMNDEITALRANFTKSLRQLDLDEVYEDLFEIMWYSQLPCFDVAGITSSSGADEASLVKRCYWKGQKVNCAAVFKTFPSDRGMCCTFNMDKAEEIFDRESKYVEMVSRMQERDSNLSFATAAEMDEGEAVFPKGERLKTEAGKHKGLTVILDAHTDLVAEATVSDDFQGFFALVEEGSKYPLVSETSFLIRPGHVSNVAIGATQVVATDGIRGVDPEVRNCYFPDEEGMRLHRVYSRANCLLECKMEYATKNMNGSDNCVPWYLPTAAKASNSEGNQTDLRICYPWETKEFLELSSKVPESACSHCLPDCVGVSYEASVSAAPFRRCDIKNIAQTRTCSLGPSALNPPMWAAATEDDYLATLGLVPAYVSKVMRNSNERSYVGRAALFDATKAERYDAYEKDIAVAHFFFRTPTVFQFTREARMTLLDFISQIGGLLGLFMGFSVISFVEVFYWFSFRLVRTRDTKRRETSSDRSNGNNAVVVDVMGDKTNTMLM